MNRNRSAAGVLRSFATGIAIVAVLGCSAGPRSSVDPTSSSGSIGDSQSATAPPAADSPDPTATASHAPFTFFPWLPSVDPSYSGKLGVDTFARAMVDVVPASGVPGGPPWRFDTGDPDPSTHPVLGFGQGALQVVVHGPVVVDGAEWYLLTPAAIAVDVPTGWSPATGPDGSAWLAPASGECPPSPIVAERLTRLALTDGLPVCYGGSEIAIEGALACGAEADPVVIGPDWLEGGTCRLDSPPTIYGLDPDLPPGRYLVTGHFNDPEARDCRPADGDASDDARLQAVLFCRRAFVASGFRPAG